MRAADLIRLWGKTPMKSITRFATIGKISTALLAAGAFGFVLLFRSCDCLPLHVGGSVRASAFEGVHVVNDVAAAQAGRFPGGRARILALEGGLGCFAPFDSSVAIACD
jgi:hypothetical protein